MTVSEIDLPAASVGVIREYLRRFILIAQLVLLSQNKSKKSTGPLIPML